jgi:predicted MFS family arabinose efflux permease
MLKKSIGIYRDSFRGLSAEMWVLSLVMLINRAGAMVLPFLTIYLTTQLGFTLPQAGWVMSSYGLGSLVGAFIGGRLTDRVGYFPVQLWSLLLTAFFFWSLPFISTFWVFCTVIFLTTTVADAFRPAAMVAVTAYSSSDNRTRSFALIRLAINLGYAIGPAVGGLLALSAGYVWLFVIDGLTCLLAGMLFGLRLRPKPAERDSGDQASEAASASNGAWRNGPYLAFMFLTVLTAVVFMQLLSTLPLYWKEVVGLNEAWIGGLFTFNCLLIVVIEMPVVYVLERRGKLDRVMARGVFFIGLTYAILLVGPDFGWIVISVLAITVGEVLNFPFANTYAVKMAPPDRQGEYMALFTMAFSVAHILAPQVGLQIANAWGFPVLWVVLTSLSLLTTTGYLLLGRTLSRESAAPATAG